VPYRNLPEIHRLRAEALGPRVAVRHKRGGAFRDVPWTDYRADALACASALADVGVRPGDRVGLLGLNRLEWLLADLGIMTAAAVNVPLHTPLTPSQIQFQLSDAGVRWLFVSSIAQLDKVRQVRRELPLIEGVVAFDPLGADDVVHWSDFLDRGRRALPRLGGELARREEALGTDDLATIMYTSGTTGNPKGVMLTHGNLITNVEGCFAASPVGPESVVLGWLPLSHIYGRTVDYYKCLMAGVTFVLAESAETVVADLAEVHPTHLSCVPRFYEKLLSTIGSPDPAETSRRLRAVFGPRMESLGSGGAPLPLAMEQTLSAAGLPIHPGYGLTESAPVLSFNTRDHYKPGTVGLPLPGVEIRIAPDGEILARGPNIMKGYWNNPEATAEAVRDGWLYTGDLGSLDEDGFLRITGRKKELVVLSNGKKVVPSYIEGLLVADECVDQAAVYGEGRQFLTALVVPHWDNLVKAMRDAGTPSSAASEAELARCPVVQGFLASRLETRLADVAGFERVKKFVVLPNPFTVAADELTVSFKLRRNVVIAKYRAELDALYRE
jgi:long-chain acyl-CoA synthetase